MSMIAGPLPSRLKLMHGFGAVAFGVKDGGFSFFLLPFYNLVLGVDAGIVGAALATALVIDALVEHLLERPDAAIVTVNAARITDDIAKGELSAFVDGRHMSCSLC